MKYFFAFIGCYLCFAACTARGAGQGSQVVVVYNTRVPESQGVAEHYAALRGVPSSQVLAFDLPDGEAMSRPDFRDHLQKPLFDALEQKGLLQYASRVIPASPGHPQRTEWRVAQASVRYLVLCYGVPVRISEDGDLREEGAEKLPPELRRNEAAVDSELPCIPISGKAMLLAGPMANPLYAITNSRSIDPTNGLLIVARLDGPSADIARGLVDKAMEAETNGLWGRAYFDTRGLTSGPLKLGDDWLHAASEDCRHVGFETIVDTNAGTFPAAFPMSQIAFYAGWYDEHASGPFARTTVEFMPGAFAYHLHSFSAGTLRSTTRQWVGPLLAKGATATMGCVAEPYLSGTPDIAIFFARFLSGFNFGEAACAAQPYLSWQTAVIGDPLYCPFARSPLELHEALAHRNSKLIEWSWLRLLNVKLANGLPTDAAIKILHELPEINESPVLQEKLADLYFAGKTSAKAVEALKNVLRLGPTPQQQTRVMLLLAERLRSLSRDDEAYAMYQQFLKDFPDYPDTLVIYKHLAELARHLGRTADAEKYQRQIDWIATPVGGAPLRPTARRLP